MYRNPHTDWSGWAITKDGQLLVVVENGFIALPGGRNLENNTALKSAIQKLINETGYKVVDPEKVDLIYEGKPDPSKDRTCFLHTTPFENLEPVVPEGKSLDVITSKLIEKKKWEEEMVWQKVRRADVPLYELVKDKIW